MKRILWVITLLIFHSFAYADADGNELLDECEIAVRYLTDRNNKTISKFEAMKVGLCLGFVESARNTIFIYESSEPNPNKLVCLPEGGISNMQAIRIVVKYLKDHPNILHRQKGYLIMWAYMDAFPCK